MPHPYVAELLHAERRRDLHAAGDRARLARQAAPRPTLMWGLVAAWREAWRTVSIPDPTPRIRDNPMRRPT